MIYTDYSLKSETSLKDYLQHYIPLVVFVTKRFGIDLTLPSFQIDHLGYQSISSEDYEQCLKDLLKISHMPAEVILHNRRVSKFRFKTPFSINGFIVPGIEVFEPKPDADISKLKAGIEHLGVVYKEDFKLFYESVIKNNVPVEKYVESPDGSFFKTKFIDLVELEFRNTPLV